MIHIVQSAPTISFIDYPEEICFLVHTTKCNFKCPYCFNLKNIQKEKQKRKHLFDITEVVKFQHQYKERSKIELQHLTISGGEPLMENINYLIQSLNLFKRCGFYIKLDTNGSYPQKLKKLLDYSKKYKKDMINYIAMDLKATSFTSDQVCISSFNMDKITYLNRWRISFKLLCEHFNNTNTISKKSFDFEIRSTVCQPFFNNICDIVQTGSFLNQILELEINKDFLDKYRFTWYLQEANLDPKIILNPSEFEMQPINLFDPNFQEKLRIFNQNSSLLKIKIRSQI